MRCFLPILLLLPSLSALAQQAAPETRQLGVTTGLESASVSELITQITELQREVQRLRGELEQQGYQVRQLKQQQRQLYTDLDQRLRLLTVPPAVTPALASVEPQTVNVTTPPPVALTSAPAQTAPADPTLYDQALEAIKQGDYPKAIAGLTQFLSQKPDAERAESAQYWLAEAFHVNRQLAEAQTAFERLLSTYPNSPKAADVLYKIALIQLDAGNAEQAKKTFTEVQTRYPNSTAARLADQRLRRLKSGG